MIYIALIASILFFAFGVMLDIRVSVRGQYFGTSESTGFLKDADNNLDVKKKVLVSIGFALAFLAVFFFIHEWVGVACFVLLGAMSVWQFFENKKKQKNARRDQLAWLARTAQYTPEMAEELYNQQHFDTIGGLKKPKSGRWYYSLFKWATAPTPEALRVKLIQLALQPPDTWIPPEGK